MSNFSRILFMGTPSFSIPTLQALVNHGKENVLGVLTRPDVERGRGKKIQYSDVKQAALDLDLEVYTPTNKQEVEELVQSLKPDLIVVIAYGMILTKTITDNYSCLNLHASILPNYRGASPIHAALLNGDKETGVSLMRMNEKCDEGAVIHIEKLAVTDADNLGTLHDKLAQVSADVLAKFLKSPKTFDINGEPQNHALASHCGKLDKSQFKLDEADGAEKNLRKIKAFSPKPGAYFEWEGKRLKVLDARVNGAKFLPLMVQPEGKKAMAFHDFCLGLTDVQKQSIQKLMGM